MTEQILYTKLDIYWIYLVIILTLVHMGCQLVIVSIKQWVIMDFTATATSMQQRH